MERWLSIRHVGPFNVYGVTETTKGYAIWIRGLWIPVLVISGEPSYQTFIPYFDGMFFYLYSLFYCNDVTVMWTFIHYMYSVMKVSQNVYRLLFILIMSQWIFLIYILYSIVIYLLSLLLAAHSLNFVQYCNALL